MKNILEKVLYGLLIGAVVMAVLGVVLSMHALTVVAIVLLILTTALYAGLQVYEYLQPVEDPKVNKQLLVMMILSVVIALAVLSLGILYIAGKLF